MRLAALLLASWLAATLAGAARAQPAPAAPVRPTAPAASKLMQAEADELLQVLRDPVQRARLIGTLEALAKALPAAQPAVAPAPASGAKPAAPTTSKAAPAKGALNPNGLGAEVLREGSQSLSALSAEALGTARNLLNFPMLWRWLHGLAADPEARARVVALGWRLALVLGGGLLAEYLFGFLSVRPRRRLAVYAPPAADWHEPPAVGGDAAQAAAEAGETERPSRPSALSLLRRLPFALLAFILDLIPLIVFVAIAYAVLALVRPAPDGRLAILAFVNAYITCRVVVAVARVLVAPDMPWMRLIHVSDRGAVSAVRWTWLIVGVAVFGRALADTTLVFGLYRPAEVSLLKLFLLVAHLLAVALVLRCRRPVAWRLRAEPGQGGAVAALRNVLAATWHVIAIFLILALWLVWAFEVPNGYARLVHVFLVTAAVLLAARLGAIVVLGLIDRSLRVRPDVASRFPELQARAHYYYPILRRIVSVLIWLFTILELLQAWGFAIWGWLFSGGIGGQAAWALVVIAITLILAVLAWEAVNLAVQRYLRRLTEAGQGARAIRLRTLVPILRAAVLVTIGAFAGLTVLAEIGVNIGPLLAGAGIVGVAVGFGSQKLVQDFITGIFLLFENAMQVGDWVTLAGLSGTVEGLSVRTIRLRGSDGSVYIVPFSSVTTVNNANRGLGNASVRVDLNYLEDTDRAGRVLQEIAAEMRRDPVFARDMLGELQLWGVDKVEGAGVTLAGQIPCTDAGRWPVQREFNRRMKQRFQEAGILVAGQPAPPAPEPAPLAPATGAAS